MWYLTINALSLLGLTCILSRTSTVFGHVGEKCPFAIFYSTCRASNSYCDSNNICRCKTGYPVIVDHHTCRRARRYGERCSVNAECTYLDVNSYCTQLPISSICECHEGFLYDTVTDSCVKLVGHGKSSGPDVILPLGVGLALAVICLVCCCLGSAHVFRRIRGHNVHRGNRRQSSSESDHRREEGTRWVQTTPSAPTTPEDALTLPPYEIAVTLQPTKDSDELPPSYEEVIKDRR